MIPSLVTLVVLPILLALRIILLLPGRKRSSLKDGGSKRKKASETCSLGVFLGSGGHTAEMVSSSSNKDDSTYTYTYTLLPLPRARKVAQPFLTTVFTTFGTLLVAIWSIFLLPLLRHPARPIFDVLLVNGPGTCVVVVAVSWVRRILGLRYTRIIYVESFARVTSLSLSAKLLRPFVDTFVVQWPQLATDGSAHSEKEFSGKGKGEGQRQGQGDGSTTSSTGGTKLDVGYSHPIPVPNPRSRSSWFTGRTIYRGWLV